jgi:hypothetical protein
MANKLLLIEGEAYRPTKTMYFYYSPITKTYESDNKVTSRDQDSILIFLKRNIYKQGILKFVPESKLNELEEYVFYDLMENTTVYHSQLFCGAGQETEVGEFFDCLKQISHDQ